MDDRDRPANERLYDTEAALRLVDKALDEICGPSDCCLDAVPGAPPNAAAPGQPAAVLALVRQSQPAPAARPALAAELAGILEDIRLGRALLDRARGRRQTPYAGGRHGETCAAIGNQYIDGAAHLLSDLEQRVAWLTGALQDRE